MPRNGSGRGSGRCLDDMDLGVQTLLALVADGIPRATAAFLNGDPAIGTTLLAEHRAARALPERLAADIGIHIARRAPVASDLRFVLTVLRVAPALGRCLQLIDHIAARNWLGPKLTGSASEVFDDLGRLTADMWQHARREWGADDPAAIRSLEEAGRRVDQAVTHLSVVLAKAGLQASVAMESATVGRFYERLGAHAADVAHRTQWSVTGDERCLISPLASLGSGWRR